MFKFIVTGDFKKADKFFNDATKVLPESIRMIFEKYGALGVETLRLYTPRDTGETADAWTYQVHSWGISWHNSVGIDGWVPLAILLQYGHGTRGGGYVQGVDYINPALRPVFDRIITDIWKEVENL